MLLEGHRYPRTLGLFQIACISHAKGPLKFLFRMICQTCTVIRGLKLIGSTFNCNSCSNIEVFSNPGTSKVPR